MIPEQSQLQAISSVQALGFHFEPVDPNNFGKELMSEFLQISYRIHFKNLNATQDRCNMFTIN
jgi:hypothetical protein